MLTAVTVSARRPPRPSPGGVNYCLDDDDEDKSSPGNSSTLSDKNSELSTARSQVCACLCIWQAFGSL